MSALKKDDPQAMALEAGLLALGQKTIGRCLQAVVKRRSELSAERRDMLNAFLRSIPVPGYREGKASPDRIVQEVARNPGLERWMFPFCFRNWMELNAGFPERIVAVGTKAAPGIDFSAADWAQIASALDPIAAQMPSHPREDIVLGLFAHRFGPVILGIDDRDPEDEIDDRTSMSDGDGVGPAGSAPSSEGGAVAAQPDPSTEASTQEAPLDPAAAAVVNAMQAVVLELTSIAPTSAIWDASVAGFIERVTALRTEKVAQRSMRTREALAAALQRLQAQSLCEELTFLRVNDTCSSWHVEAVAADDIPGLLDAIPRLATHVEAHRMARLGAQHAADDDELEAHTARRKESKASILALIAEIGRSFPTPSSPAAEPPSRGQASPAMVVPAPDRPDVHPHASPGNAASGQAPSSEASTAATGSFPARRLPEPEAASSATRSSSPAIPLAEPGANPQEPPVRRASSPAIPLADPAPGVLASPKPGSPADLHDAWDVAGSRPVAPGAVNAAEGRATDEASAVEPPPAVQVSRTPTADLGVSRLLELPTEITSYEQFREHFWTGPSLAVEPTPWRDPSFVKELGAAATAKLRAGPARVWELLVLCRALDALGGEAPLSSADVRSAAALWIAPQSPSAGVDPDRCERLRSGRAAFGSSHQRLALVLEALRPCAERQLLTHETETLLEHAGFQFGALRVVVHRFLNANAQGHDPIQLVRRSRRVVPQHGQHVSARLEAARKALQTLVTRVWSAAGGKIERTHCRRAWSEFIDRIQPSLTRLYPAPRGDNTWSVKGITQEVDGYAAALDDVCEKYGAKFDDKRRMLRTAGEIVDAARRVIELRREELTVDDERRTPFALPQLELEQLHQRHCCEAMSRAPRSRASSWDDASSSRRASVRSCHGRSEPRRPRPMRSRDTLRSSAMRWEATARSTHVARQRARPMHGRSPNSVRSSTLLCGRVRRIFPGVTCTR